MLRVSIDRSSKKARFSGDSTFAAKDQLKAIFGARWLGVEKVWEASSFIDSVDELKEKLFDYEIEVVEVGQLSPNDIAAKDGNKDIPKGLSVPQVINSVRVAVEERFRGGVLVFGVITSLKTTANQRAFITLSDIEDRTISLNCVYWGDIGKLNAQLASFRLELEVDLEVMFQVDISLNPKNGNLSPKILRIVPEYTLAKLQGEREKTNQRLKEEGIFEQNKNLKFPFLPINIGVLTSSGGTVIHDFKVALEVANFGFKLFWLPVSVQGSSAKAELVQAIGQLSRNPNLDLIVLFRGGGSVSDLAVFNTYEVAREIARCRLPVLAAIGHQEDQSSAQDVSYRSFGVPRDLGIFLSSIVVDVRRNIESQIGSIGSGLSARLELVDTNLKALSAGIVQSGDRLIDRYLQRIFSLQESMAVQSGSFLSLLEERSRRATRFIHSSCAQLLRLNQERISGFKNLAPRARQYLETKERSLLSLSAHVSEAAPDVQLRRGYSIVRSSGGFIKSTSQLQVNDRLAVEFIDGEARVQILEIDRK